MEAEPTLPCGFALAQTSGAAAAEDASEICAAELLADPELVRELMQLQQDCERVPSDQPSIEIGKRVKLKELVTSEDLNGCCGHVVREENGRWIVQLDDADKEIALKQENLEVLEDIKPLLATWVCSEEGLCVVGRARLPRENELRYGAVAQISVRGSKNIENWLTNFTAQLVASEIGECKGRIHRGFQVAHAKLRDTVLAKMQESLAACSSSSRIADKPILALVVGHSLGGALATLLAYTVALHGCETRCVTWGAPRVGDIDFRDAYRAVVPSTVRFVNRSDPVPRVPFNPEDPYDDGVVLAGRLSNWLQKAHTVANAKDYCHVCKGTALGIEKSSLNRALASINAALEQGVAAGFSEFSASHLFATYITSVEKAMSGGTSQEDHDRAAQETAAHAAAAAVAAVGAVGGLVRGLSQRWANRQSRA
mmetsp:Transcript_18296/g.33632  ORF Transcript_18296/g.33632 Transcript_18296/m.33632 type:complete len:426 (-) Transcript_18296:235-1512(-)